MITLALTAIPSTIYDRSTSPEIRINIQLSKHFPSLLFKQGYMNINVKGLNIDNNKLLYYTI